MRLIYIDEAGTSEFEPVRVVASVIVHGDNQLRELIDEISLIVNQLVPVELRASFHIHAKEIYSGGKNIDRGKWPKAERIEFLKEIARILFRRSIPISVGIAHRGAFADNVLVKAKEYTQREMEHFNSFANCVERADKFLRKYLGGNEIGHIVAENVPRMKHILKKAARFYKDYPKEFKPGALRAERWELELNSGSYGELQEIRNIIDAPHFAEKEDAPLLQLADVCAFSVRRCLAKLPDGDGLLKAMLGDDQGNMLIDDPVWFEHSSSGLFNTSAYWNDDQKRDHQLRLAAHIISVVREGLKE